MSKQEREQLNERLDRLTEAFRKSDAKRAQAAKKARDARRLKRDIQQSQTSANAEWSIDDILRREG